jgi:NAD(P)-dependent dehydrogenase (short-subunit alcohol dehydrogenase family)
MAENAIVISGSSDIGAAAIGRWLDRGWTVSATYRRSSLAVDALTSRGARFLPLDLDDPAAVRATGGALGAAGAWDVFMTCPATLEPIAPFETCDFAAWERSIAVNFTRQMELLHAVLPARRRDGPRLPLVILWAGPGSNNAPLNYSAQIVSKISLIKMCELLDAEIADCRFVIIGPGWVKTKIHEETLRAGPAAGLNHERTVARLDSDQCTPMERVLAFIDWCLDCPKDVIGGRNLSIVYDLWEDPQLTAKLAATPDMYKLRRFLNEWKGNPSP